MGRQRFYGRWCGGVQEKAGVATPCLLRRIRSREGVAEIRTVWRPGRQEVCRQGKVGGKARGEVAEEKRR